MINTRIFIIVFLLLSINISHAQTIEFQEALDYLNKVRSSPNSYSNELGVSLINVDPMHPLKWNNYLAVAAQRKAQDMADRNYFAHVDPDGYGMNYFIQNAGYQLNSKWLTNISENYFESISAGSKNPLEAIKDLIIDDGVVGLGHRKHLLSIDDFRKPSYDIGIGWGYNMNSQYKTYCCVLIAKHDWNGDTPMNNKIIRNTHTNSSQNSQSNYNEQTIKKKEPEKLLKTKRHKLLSFKIGGSTNFLFDDVKNLESLNSDYSNQLSYQLNSMIGLNLGKSRKNTTIGLFGNYGKYNSYNTTLLNNNFFNTNENFLEIEGGFLIKEILRLSGGLGYSSSNSINLSFNNYSTFSAGLSIGPKWLKFDINNTIIIPQNNEAIFYRTSLGLSFVLNFANKKYRSN